jgi:hypothetical protein
MKEASLNLFVLNYAYETVEIKAHSGSLRSTKDKMLLSYIINCRGALVPPSDKIVVFLSECGSHYYARGAITSWDCVCVRAVHSHESIIFFAVIVCLAGEHRALLWVSVDKMQMRIKSYASGSPRIQLITFYICKDRCAAWRRRNLVIACVRRFVLCARLINYKKMCHAWHQMTNVLCSVLAFDGSRTRNFTMRSLDLFANEICGQHSGKSVCSCFFSCYISETPESHVFIPIFFAIMTSLLFNFEQKNSIVKFYRL